MSEEYDCPADFQALLAQRIAAKKADGDGTNPTVGFDPHKAMMQRKSFNDGTGADIPIQSWPEADIKKLEDFCKQHGIIGFSCGRLSPIVALSMLKQKLGVVDNDVPNFYNQNNRYENIINNKKILLKG